MVRNVALSALVALVTGERATVFPFIAPQNMKFKHELKEDASFDKYQHHCYAFIYAVVGKGDAKAIQNLPSLVGPLCRASEGDCELYTASLRTAIEQKELQMKLSRGNHPYADWCKQLYNRQHPAATHTTTTTAMPPQHHSSPGLRGHKAAAAGQAVAPGVASEGAKAPERLAASQPLTTATAKTAKARLPLQLAKSATAPTPIVSKEINDMANDVGNFQRHFIADMTGQAIASTAAQTVDPQQLGGAEVAFDRAFVAVNQLDNGGHEHSHHHWHHVSH